MAAWCFKHISPAGVEAAHHAECADQGFIWPAVDPYCPKSMQCTLCMLCTAAPQVAPVQAAGQAPGAYKMWLPPLA